MFLPLSLVSLALLAPADDTPVKYARPELLLETHDLAKPETLKRFRILDARDKVRYEATHLPGAVWVDTAGWAKAFAAGQDRADWTKRIGELGIDRDTPVVIYDDSSFREAARVWWILRYWGIKEVRLLNGGPHSWARGGGPVTRDIPKVKPLEPKLEPQPTRLATRDFLMEALKGKPQLLDTRSREEHCGESQLAKRGGAIPGSIHLEWSDLVSQKLQRFKSPDELARILKDSGIDLNRETTTYCQSGGRAAVTAFVLELMGAKEVRNYYRSWAEWGNADDTPIVKPKK